PAATATSRPRNRRVDRRAGEGRAALMDQSSKGSASCAREVDYTRRDRFLGTRNVELVRVQSVRSLTTSAPRKPTLAGAADTSGLLEQDAELTTASSGNSSEFTQGVRRGGNLCFQLLCLSLCLALNHGQPAGDRQEHTFAVGGRHLRRLALSDPVDD